MNFNEYRVNTAEEEKETGNSIVYPAVKNGLRFAIKVAMNPEHDATILNNAMYQMNLDHQNIVKVFGCEKDKSTGRHFAVMEYVDKPTLEELVQTKYLTFGQRLEIIAMMIDALHYSNSMGKPHGDISRKNFFADTGFLKVTDFTYDSRLVPIADSREVSLPVLRSLEFMAPEQKNEDPVSSEKADVYALAMCAFWFLYGREPPRGNRFDYSAGKSFIPGEELGSFFTACFEHFPGKRHNLGEAGEAFSRARIMYDATAAESPSLFEDELEMLDVALQQEKIGKGKEAGLSFEMALGIGALRDNDTLVRNAAINLIYSGKFKGAYGLLKETAHRDLQQALVEAAIEFGDKESRRFLINGLGITEVTEAAVNTAPCGWWLGKHCSNNMGVCLATKNPQRAIIMFRELLSQKSGDNVLMNNLGAAYAIAREKKAVKFLRESSLWQSSLNLALFYLQEGELGNAINAAGNILHEPKADAIIKTALPGKQLQIADKNIFLFRQFMQEFSVGVKPQHYELIML